MFDGWFVCGVYRHFQQYSSYILAVNFICGGNWSTQRKPTTCRKSLTNLFENKWSKMQRYFFSSEILMCLFLDWLTIALTNQKFRYLHRISDDNSLMCFRFYIECIKYIAMQPNFDGRLFSTDCLFEVIKFHVILYFDRFIGQRL